MASGELGGLPQWFSKWAICLLPLWGHTKFLRCHRRMMEN